MEHKLPTSFHHVRLSIVPLALQLFFILFLMDTLYVLALWIFYVNGTIDATVAVGVLWILHTLNFLVTAALSLGRVLTWATTIYYTDEHHLTLYTGIFTSDERVFEMRSLRAVNRHQGWFGKICNYGDLLMVFGASGYREEVWLRGIRDPHHYERVFSSYLGAESREFLPTGEIVLTEAGLRRDTTK